MVYLFHEFLLFGFAEMIYQIKFSIVILEKFYVFIPLTWMYLQVLFSWIQKEAVYGLTEIVREEIKNARLVANPGCYPTSIQLPLVPLIKVCLVFWFCFKFQFLVRLMLRVSRLITWHPISDKLCVDYVHRGSGSQGVTLGSNLVAKGKKEKENLEYFRK